MVALAGSQEAAKLGRGRIWGAVIILTLVGILNYVDRFLPAVLAEPIKQELELSDTALGLINGFGFLVIYSVIGIPIARLADRGAYGLVVTTSLSLWSAMTVLGGLAQTGWQLALTRMGVAVGEAGSTPAAHAFISRSFDPDKRALPLAFLTMAVPLANIASLVGGGILGEAFGWRNVFFGIGLVGLVLAPIVFVLLGTRSKTVKSLDAHTSALLRPGLVLFKKVSFVATIAATACIGMGGYAMTAFGPAFLMRAHGMSLSEVGVQYGLANGVAGLAGLLVMGVVSDRLSRRDPRWLLWLVAAMLLISIPFSVAGFLVPDQGLAIMCMAIAYIAGAAYLVPTVAALQRLAPVHLRATASALMLFFTALLGGAGPLVAGMISDALQPELGDAALGRALLILVPAIHVVSAIFYLMATRFFLAEVNPEDVREAA